MNPQPKPQRRPKKSPKPLRRRKAMRKALPRRVTRPGPGSDQAYLAEVRKLPCMLFLDECEGDVVAHHAGPKTNDSTAVPLCWKHHQNWHDARGPFVGLDKENRRTWAAVAIELTRARTQGESR